MILRILACALTAAGTVITAGRVVVTRAITNTSRTVCAIVVSSLDMRPQVKPIVLATITAYLDALQQRKDWQPPGDTEGWRELLLKYFFYVSPTRFKTFDYHGAIDRIDRYYHKQQVK